MSGVGPDRSAGRTASTMNTPEKIAAILAIHLQDARQKETRIKGIFEFWFNHRDRIEKLADMFLKKDDLPIKPYMPTSSIWPSVTLRIIRLIRLYLQKQKVVDWIAESGGIPVLLLKQMASGVGPCP
jgi:hypothetical protein